MLTIWKYKLTLQKEVQRIKMPVGARILHVGVQADFICLWALVNSESDQDNRRDFYIRSTGRYIESYLTYVGTVQMLPFVWHVFEAGRDI
jgi:hypothetical protein